MKIKTTFAIMESFGRVFQPIMLSMQFNDGFYLGVFSVTVCTPLKHISITIFNYRIPIKYGKKE